MNVRELKWPLGLLGRNLESQHAQTIEMVRHHIRSHPDRLAITAPERTVTYAELGALADRLSIKFRNAGLREEDVVILCLPSSPEFVAAAFAVMNLGSAYLPVDESCPIERLSFMAADSGARFVVMESWAEGVELPVHIVALNRIQEDECDQPNELQTSQIHPESLAYLIYTSGSTGQPKAVEITHRGLSNLVAWHNSEFRITTKDRGSQIASLAFDAAVWEIWPYLAAGATLCMPERGTRQHALQLQSWLLAEKITVAFAPTALAEQLLQLTWPSRAPLRILLTGGEALRVYPNKGIPFALINNYGPTECTVVATSGRLSAEDTCGASPGIGYPITNVEVHLLAEDLKAVEPGQAGEICIGGAGLARGYRNRPELTAEKFIANPFDGARTARLYRTGDLARTGKDGQLQYLGRIDDQIKVRGYRIEPNEIAVAVCRHPSIRQCVVIAREFEGEKQLIAYVVPSGALPVSQPDLHDFLSKTLPSYMIPAAFVTLDELPLTTNGKVNPAALPSPFRQDGPEPGAEVLTQTKVEQQIAAIVRDLLNVDEVGVEENIFLLGGHSLFGAQLIASLRKRFDAELPLRTVFQFPTVRGLAQQIEQFRRQILTDQK